MRGRTLVVPTHTGLFLCGMAVRACTLRNQDGVRVLDARAVKSMPIRDFRKSLIKRDLFAACGGITNEDSLWLRKQCMILAKNYQGDISFWLSRPLMSLRHWIKANNAIVEDGKEGGNGQ